MEAFLRNFLPRLLTKSSFAIYAHQSKQEMLGRLEARLLGYSKWLPSNMRVIVLLDRDRDDCIELKARLEAACGKANLRTPSSSGGAAYQVLNRIVVEELEAWYFGDWEAVRTAYPKSPANVSSKSQYRNPDNISGGTWEAFERVMQRAGYFKGGLRKIEAAQNIAPHITVERNTSHSFRLLCDALASFEGK